MMLHIVGGSHAPIVFRCAAQMKGIALTDDIKEASIVLISEDTPTDEAGSRDEGPIIQHVYESLRATECPVILTSQVTPGFTRKFNTERLYHQAETLRIKDAMIRAMYPEQIILGVQKSYDSYIHPEVHAYYAHWDAPVIRCSYEEAEFSKIAINVHLAHQVELANALLSRADLYGCDWKVIQRILKNDHRIGPHAYTTPGDWRKSKHLLRDYVTFYEAGDSGSAITQA